ncbi:MAG: hypothetical protein KGZ42_08525 [Melioribacter sp.]|nr:hypothetical protein [Melioribacter sp.]
MINLIRIIFGFFILSIITPVSAQIILQDYEEGANFIRLVLTLDEITLREKKSQQGYFDESNPGKFSLPKRTIFIAVPVNNNFTINSSILQSKQFAFNLGLNPQVLKSSDTTFSYNYSPDFYYAQSNSDIVKFCGYQTIEKYQCAELQIEQFTYNVSSRLINQIEKIELLLRFQNPLILGSSNSIRASRNSSSSIIINAGQTKIGNLHTVQNEPKINSDWIDDGLQYVKVGTNADGIYRVTGQQLQNLGVNINLINPSTLKIFLLGSAIPIYVKTNIPGTFVKDDFLEFIGKRNYGGEHRSISRYGEPYKEYLDRYSDTTVYWITWNTVNSPTVKVVSSTVSSNTDTLSYYYEINHFEQNNWFDFSGADLVRKELPYWSENKTWGWSGLSVGTRNNAFTTTNLFPNKPIRVYAKMQSYAFSNPIRPHHLAISLNSSPVIDSTYINQYGQIVLQGEFSSNYIIQGNNTFRVHSYSTGGSINLCFFDWYEVEYPRYLIPREGKLYSKFSFLPGKKEYFLKIRNVTNTSYSLWVTGDKAKRFSVPIVNNQIVIHDTISAQSELFYCEETKIPFPIFYYQKKFDRLTVNSNKAEYILITNKKFLARAKDYAKFISDSYNMITKIVDVDDIYDEFSYGFFNPEAIRSFLKSAYYNWQTPSIKYVCIVGGATYDYHGNKATYQGAPRFYNYVPSFGSPVSDTWFVVFDSSRTIIPDISIGRIPVTTNQEFDWYFQKHKEYLRHPFNAWNKRVIFFSGGTGNDQSQIDALRNVNEFIIQNYVNPKPYSGKFTHFYKTINPVNNFGPYSAQQIARTIDSGGVFISYLGHSGTQTWDNSITDPMQLQNKVNCYPLITDFGCSTARFAEPDVISFSQTFVNNGQAIAYIANSSLGFTSTSYTFPQIFYKKLLADSVYTIGDAHRIAKLDLISKYGASGVYQLFALTNTLIGDPIINLKLPPKSNLVVSESDIKILDNNFSDRQDSLGIKINISNYGLSINSSYKIQIQDHYKNSLNYSKEFTRIIPDFADSVFIKIPVKELSGEHRISVNLDKDDAVKEIYEDDNIAAYQFIVPSGSVKYLITSHVENYLKNPVRILSPSAKNEASSYILEVAENGKFYNAIQYQIKLDTIKTDFNIDNRFKNKRVWLRTKTNISDSISTAITFKLANKNSYSLFDSLSFSNQPVNNFKVRDYLSLDSLYVKFRLLSAGLNDGNTALILKNGQNFIPENTLRGHHVAIFKGRNLEYAGYKRFDVYGGGTSVTNEYINFLDTLSSD